MVLGKARGFTQIGLRRLNVIGMRFVLGLMFRYDETMKNPNKKLLDLMAKHELTQVDLVVLCQCSRTTVHYWTRNPDNPDFQVIKPAYLRLLEFELGEARRQRTRGNTH